MHLSCFIRDEALPRHYAPGPIGWAGVPQVREDSPARGGEERIDNGRGSFRENLFAPRLRSGLPSVAGRGALSTVSELYPVDVSQGEKLKVFRSKENSFLCKSGPHKYRSPRSVGEFNAYDQNIDHMRFYLAMSVGVRASRLLAAIRLYPHHKLFKKPL